ncbi:hypothetical protein ACFPL7_07510 [Dongia soli]|uniref:DUF1134 domain-containing protein n=1 Tax=Dongia soli TaxID=600628 RepID=A0ABU5E8W4_9PROT|nr:hypothetical protein [Dongia soli]MDY0882792.1 hypothetical protein [Dongia soli]
MQIRHSSRRRLLLSLCGLGLVHALPADAEDPTPSGTVEISQVQIAFIGSGNLGGGTLHYQDNSYSFTIGGLGIGGFGISKMEAIGTVYDLHRLSDFKGAYIQGRYGYAAGEAGSGDLWLKNASGVVLQLKTKRQGLALSLGGDAVYIDFD